jgi:DNA-binding protein YbaB
MAEKPEFNMQNAIAELRAEQAKIQEAGERMNRLTGSASSADRMITATVDSQGRLVDLKLAGGRYRKLAPAELTGRIVETVRAAQENAARQASDAFAGLLPPGLGMPVGGEFDLDAMFDAAVSAALATEQTMDGANGNG